MCLVLKIQANRSTVGKFECLVKCCVNSLWKKCIVRYINTKLLLTHTVQISLHSIVYFSDDGLTSFASVDRGQFVETIFNLLHSHVGLS